MAFKNRNRTRRRELFDIMVADRILYELEQEEEMEEQEDDYL